MLVLSLNRSPSICRRLRAKYGVAEVATAVCGVQLTCLVQWSKSNTCRPRCGGNVINFVEQNFHMQDAVCAFEVLNMVEQKYLLLGAV